MKYEIWQLKKENMRAYGFMDYDWAKEHGFSLNDYEKTYEGEIDGATIPAILEDLFMIFNIRRPEDFKGRSLSVSDIICLDGKRYYCEPCGYMKIA